MWRTLCLRHCDQSLIASSSAASCCVLHATQLRARRVLPVCPTLSALPPSQLRHKSFRSWVIWASVIFQLPVLALPRVSIKILLAHGFLLSGSKRTLSTWPVLDLDAPSAALLLTNASLATAFSTLAVRPAMSCASLVPLLRNLYLKFGLSGLTFLFACRSTCVALVLQVGSLVMDHLFTLRLAVPFRRHSDNVQSWSQLRPFDGSCLTAWRVSISFQDPTCAIFCVFASPMAFPSIVVNLCASITILHVRTSPNEQMR